MSHTFRLSAAIVVLLDVIHAAAPALLTMLPIGGAHMTQMAIVFGLAFVASEISSIVAGK